MLSVVQYTPYSTSDNMPASENNVSTAIAEHAPESVDPPEALPASPEGVPLMPARPAGCLAASHQLLWRWSAGTWQCPACGT
jgi:hypothetical protein